jgi:hypothetical protein
MKSLNGISFVNGNYKYQLKQSYSVQTCIFNQCYISTEYIKLEATGLLTIKEGYAWDGATWCPDFDTIMRASLIHDALCQLIDLKLLDVCYQTAANRELWKACIEDGMNRILAEVIYRAVHLYFKFKDSK